MSSRIEPAFPLPWSTVLDSAGWLVETGTDAEGKPVYESQLPAHLIDKDHPLPATAASGAAAALLLDMAQDLMMVKAEVVEKHPVLARRLMPTHSDVADEPSYKYRAVDFRDRVSDDSAKVHATIEEVMSHQMTVIMQRAAMRTQPRFPDAEAIGVGSGLEPVSSIPSDTRFMNVTVVQTAAMAAPIGKREAVPAPVWLARTFNETRTVDGMVPEMRAALTGLINWNLDADLSKMYNDHYAGRGVSDQELADAAKWIRAFGFMVLNSIMYAFAIVPGAGRTGVYPRTLMAKLAELAQMYAPLHFDDGKAAMPIFKPREADVATDDDDDGGAQQVTDKFAAEGIAFRKVAEGYVHACMMALEMFGEFLEAFSQVHRWITAKVLKQRSGGALPPLPNYPTAQRRERSGRTVTLPSAAQGAGDLAQHRVVQRRAINNIAGTANAGGIFDASNYSPPLEQMFGLTPIDYSKVAGKVSSIRDLANHVDRVSNDVASTLTGLKHMLANF